MKSLGRNSRHHRVPQIGQATVPVGQPIVEGDEAGAGRERPAIAQVPGERVDGERGEVTTDQRHLAREGGGAHHDARVGPRSGFGLVGQDAVVHQHHGTAAEARARQQREEAAAVARMGQRPLRPELDRRSMDGRSAGSDLSRGDSTRSTAAAQGFAPA